MIIVRPATNDDANGVALLLGQMGYPTTAHAARAKLDMLAADKDTPVYVALLGGGIVGVAAIQVSWDLYSPYSKAELTTLVVDANLRRSGVGRQLIDHVTNFACKAGCKQIDLITALHRADAHEFYKSLGFVQSAIRMHKDL